MAIFKKQNGIFAVRLPKVFCLAMLMGALFASSAIFAKDKIFLHQSDFDSGTYIIDKPGVYVLAEDISFNPNHAAMLGTEAYFASFPLPEQFAPSGVYNPRAYGLGFFAAITIQAKNVVLDLNGHTLEQSKEHALLQRFYANIELADQPFVVSQGPAHFGSTIESAENVLIKNGTIGRSSHHGIHGNGAKNIQIKNVDFVDFEVAAVALNGVEGLKIINSTATNRKDVPVLGTFSSAQFIKPYIEFLFNKHSAITLRVQGVELSVSDIREKLRNSINNVYADIITNGGSYIDQGKHPDDYKLYHNVAHVVDGNSYGYLVNKLGVAVNGFPMQPTDPNAFSSKNIMFKNVRVLNHLANIREIVALKKNGKAVNDPVGAIFQVKNLDPEGNPITVSSTDDASAMYVGNVVANAQAFVAKAALNGEFEGSHLDISRLSITQDVIDWIETDGAKLSDLVAGDGYLCNGDSMFHVNKGVIAFKIDAAENIQLADLSAKNIKNLGAAGSKLCGGYEDSKSHPKATLQGYRGSRVCGYSFAGSTKVEARNLVAENLASNAGTGVGFDVFTDSDKVFLEAVSVKGIQAGMNFNASDIDPTQSPDAIGIHVGDDTSKIQLRRYCAENLSAFSHTFVLKDDSGHANAVQQLTTCN